MMRVGYKEKSRSLRPRTNDLVTVEVLRVLINYSAVRILAVINLVACALMITIRIDRGQDERTCELIAL